ncbi:MAG: hypothetical protein QOD74_2935, partial [Variibacter sp.]|nr:hypothetical protein [Variibacter sp.]
LGRAGASSPPAADARRGAGTDLESVVDSLEDAVALFSPAGELIFSNAAMKALLPGPLVKLPSSDPIRQLVERTLAGRRSTGPVSVSSSEMRALMSGSESDATVAPVDGAQDGAPEKTDRLLMSHAIEDTGGRFLGAMLVSRNIGYLSQVHSTLNYSRKLAALGRLMAGVAHEVKNPLNAMTIHLELLKTKLASQSLAAAHAGDRTVTAGALRLRPQADGAAGVTKHVEVIAAEIRRLDEVVNGFLKFARPEELRLQPVHLRTLISDVATTAGPEAVRRNVIMKTECPDSLPDINADPGMLGQALLNLALNGCQAMPDGGTLKITCRAAARRSVQVDVEDTGVGIPPEHLSRIFDLYFTTKEKGSGIGLSMVYRIVQLHDGEVEVQSIPGRGTRFRLIFPQA